MNRKVDLTQVQVPSDDPIDSTDEHLEGDEAILKQARDRMNDGYGFWERTFRASKEDVEFCYEQQWPDYALEGREDRPTLTMNKLTEFVHQVTGAARQNKFSIRIAQMSGVNDLTPHATQSNVMYTRSQIMEGLIRDIEYRSKAARLYCRALQHSVEGGIGWLMVKTERPPDDPFSVDLCIHHIRDRWSPMIDPHCEKEDYSDARWCSVAKDIPFKEFERQWPGIPVDRSPGRMREEHGVYWSGQNENVRVSDYYFKQPMTREAIEYIRQTPDNFSRLVLYKDEIEPIQDELRDLGFVVTNRAEVDSYKTRYMRHTYNHVLDGIHDWPSIYLPLVPVIGRHVNLPKKNMYIGLLRYAHDPQRMYNFWVSAATERVALSPKNPYIADADSVRGYEDDWKNMYDGNEAVLLYRHREGVPPPRREPPATLPTAEMQLITQSDIALRSAVGMHEANLGRRSNEVSGRAIEARQDQGATSTYEFMDNLKYSLVTVGEILADMIPRIYTEERARRIVMPDDSTSEVFLNQTIEDSQTGRKFRMGSLDTARYSARVSVGPHTSTQREEFVRMMIEWGRSDPEALALVRDLVVSRMDFPEAREISMRLKAMVPRNLLSAEDQATMPEPQMTPAQQLEALKHKAEEAKARADIVTARADIARSQLKVQGEEARRDFEIERSLNRVDAELKKLDDEVSKAAGEDGELRTMVKEILASLLAERGKTE